MTRQFSLLFIALMFVLQGCATAITKGADRRTDGVYIEDSSIEKTALERISKQYGEKVHINVSSYNRKVLVTGEVPEAAAKLEITRIVGTVQNVTDIFNELTVGFHSTFSARSNDALITSNIKIRLRNTSKDFFRADRVKVVTEKNIVYLMGLVTHAEAEVATEVASTSSGVNKVVPYFEFID